MRTLIIYASKYGAAKQIAELLGGIMQYDKINFVYRKIFQSLKKIDGFNKEFKEPKIEIELIDQIAGKLK